MVYVWFFLIAYYIYEFSDPSAYIYMYVKTEIYASFVKCKIRANALPPLR